MNVSMLHRIDLVARGIVPTVLALFLVLVGVVPLHLPHFLSLGASLALIAVYYWSVHQPSLMPVPAVFLIGLISDCFGGAPVGVGVLVLLLVHRLVTGQRRLLLGASFIVVWWGFMMVAAAATVAAWLAACLLDVGLVDPAPALFSYLLSLCLYPAVAFVFSLLQRSILRGL
jgi:rod shape-determining protein MreD